MTARDIWSRVAAALLIGGALASLACDKKDKVTNPQPGAPLASIATVWPNDDGHSWQYRYVVERWQDSSSVGLFANASQVPPAPSLTAIQGLLGTLPKGDSANTDTTTLSLQFMGEVMTFSGVIAQYLAVTPGPVSRPALASTGGRDPFLAQLREARPDLRARIDARIGAAPATLGTQISGPIFLPGYAWQKRSNDIIAYGDIDTLPSWTYLKADLVAGAEFSHHLIPLLVNDVYLHARIVGYQPVTTPAGIYSKAIEVLYLLDYGVATLTDEQGQPTASYRDISFGTVSYVDSVGPVACSERALVRVGVNHTYSNGVGADDARYAPIVLSAMRGMRRRR